MEENLFVSVEQFPVKHAAPRFSVRKNVAKKKHKKRVAPGWTDISGPDPVSFLSRSSMYYITLTHYAFFTSPCLFLLTQKKAVVYPFGFLHVFP